MITNNFYNGYEDYTVELRRYFHSIAEVGFSEIETTKKIIAELDKYGIKNRKCSKTGVIGEIGSSESKNVVALRADIDALPILEENDLPYKSKNEGIMHACGHDCHTAMLLTAARILKENEEKLEGRVRLIFQPAEEGSQFGQGAEYMIEEGALEGVKSVFGMHIMPEIEGGKIAAMPGAIMASTDEFEIIVTGHSGHGATPQYCVDSVVVASAIVMNLQTIVSRELSPLEPAVVSVGTINGGDRWNVIAGEVKLTGTVRTFSHDVSEKMLSSIERIITSTASSYKATAKIKYKNNVKATINDEACIDIVKKSVAQIYGKDNLITVEKQMGGEDFSEYAHRVPSAFCFLGVGDGNNKTKNLLHNSKFTVNEDFLPIGVNIMVKYAMNFLKDCNSKQ